MTRPSEIIPIRIPEKLHHPVSRLAPTPSGLLHLGNAVNFLITWALVRSHGGRLHLRIDDMDSVRFREEALEDIFASLAWLGMDWDSGPNGPEDFHRNFSLQARREHYRDQLKRLADADGRVFTCVCSRSAIKKSSANGLYPKTCRNSGHAFMSGQRAIRLGVDDHCLIQVNGQRIDLAKTFGDFVLWRRDDQPSYQLASLLEDEEAGINLIVRGSDLLNSSAAQLYLAERFGFTSFPASRFVHHGLILGDDGNKLSKSRGAQSLRSLRKSSQGPDVAVKVAARFLGISGEQVLTAKDLLEKMQEAMTSETGYE